MKNCKMRPTDEEPTDDWIPYSFLQINPRNQSKKTKVNIRWLLIRWQFATQEPFALASCFQLVNSSP